MLLLDKEPKMAKESLDKLLVEYGSLHNAGMTNGERFSNEGQAKLDREWELLQILSDAHGLKPYDFVFLFESGSL